MDTAHRYTKQVLFLCRSDADVEFTKLLPMWAVPAPGDEIRSRELMDAFGTPDTTFNVLFREWSWDEDKIIIEVSYYDPLPDSS